MSSAHLSIYLFVFTLPKRCRVASAAAPSLPCVQKQVALRRCTFCRFAAATVSPSTANPDLMLLSHIKLPIGSEAGQTNFICKVHILYYLVTGCCRWVSPWVSLQFSEIAPVSLGRLLQAPHIVPMQVSDALTTPGIMRRRTLVQHSRSSWDMKCPLETELPTTYYSLTLMSPHWRGLSFAQLISFSPSSPCVAQFLQPSGMVLTHLAG